jgi:hypothetical protein
MKSALSIRDTAFTTGFAILMARLVDGSGAAVRRADVLAVDYSIYELDPCWPNNLTIIAGCRHIELDVEEVLFDAVQSDNMWTVDDTGYNFRHEIRPARAQAFPKAGVDYELQYRFTSRCGQKITVRFRIRCSMLVAGYWS